MHYEITKKKEIFISLFVFSIISSLGILFAPFKIHSSGLKYYVFLSGIGFGPEYAIAIILPLFIIFMALILIPLYILAFKKQFSSVALRNMRRMTISGSVLGILLSVSVTDFTPETSGIEGYTAIIGLPYIYFISIIVLNAIALHKKNIPKVFSEIKNN